MKANVEQFGNAPGFVVHLWLHVPPEVADQEQKAFVCVLRTPAFQDSLKTPSM
jgi:hypothetical protein